MSIKTGSMGTGGGGGGGSQNLQQVTNVGNVTTNPIQIGPTLVVTNVLGTNTINSETSAGNFINTTPKQTGIIQNSGNGLLLPQVTKGGGLYHPLRNDHVIFVDLSGGGVSLDITLDNALLAFPGIQIVFKVIKFNAGGIPSQALKLLPESGTIDGQSSIVYRMINLFGIRVTNDGTNWWVLDVMTGAEIVASTPTIAVNGGAGAGASAIIQAGSSDNVGQFSVTFGIGANSAASFCSITFARPWPVVPRGIFLQAAGNDNRGTYLGYASVIVPTALILVNKFSITLPDDGVSVFDGVTCSWMFTVVQ